MAKGKISRKDFLKGSLLVGGALAVGRYFRNRFGRDFDQLRTEKLLDGIKPSAAPQNLPNMVVILVDDLGRGDWGGPGDGMIDTPNLDQMAQEGVLMTNFYASAPVCTPSRAALLTGRYAVRSHMTLPLYPKNHPMEYLLKLVDRYQYDVTGIPEDEALLPEILKRRGYRTGMVGKWHLGDQPGHLPNDNGFDSFYGVLYSNDQKKMAVLRNSDVEIPTPVEQSQLTQLYTQEALDFIEANQGHPFFLYLAHTAVHEPLFASEEYQHTSQAGLYGDAVQELDWSVGAVLKKISDLGLDDKTFVVFSSDNGPWWQGSTGGLRGRKNNIADGGFRVPMIARWPKTLPAGLVTNEFGVNFDLFSTCLAIADTTEPEDRIIDGRNLIPLLRGEADSPHDRFFYYDGPILAAVRYKQWKYQRRHMSDNGGYPIFSQGPFLFDLDRDPSESYNLMDSYPEVTRQLVQMLDDWETEMDENVRGWL
jgi:arylsulfatase A